MGWMLFLYHGTLSPHWQYMHALIEAERDTALKYLKDHYDLDEEYVNENFQVQHFNSLLEVASLLQINILDLQNNKYTLIIDNANFWDGCFCKKCKEYYPYAEPNQSDGSMICYGCRMVFF